MDVPLCTLPQLWLKPRRKDLLTTHMNILKAVFGHPITFQVNHLCINPNPIVLSVDALDKQSPPIRGGNGE